MNSSAVQTRINTALSRNVPAPPARPYEIGTQMLNPFDKEKNGLDDK